MIVVVDEGVDPGFQIARQIIVLQQDAVLERLMPAFDLALCLRMAWGAAHMTHVAFVQPFGQTGRDVGGTIIREQSGTMNGPCVIEPRGLQREVQRFCDVLDLHRRAELPGDDATREAVQYRAEVEPALRLPSSDASHRRTLGRLRPAGHLEIGEAGLPKLVWCRRLVLELIGGFHDNVGGTGDQIMLLEQAIDGSLRDKIVFRVCESCRKFPWRQLRLVQSQLHDLATDIVGDAIPDALRPGRSIFRGFHPAGLAVVAPSVKGGARNAGLFQRPARWQMRLLDQPDDLQLFGSGIPYSSPSPSAIMLF